MHNAAWSILQQALRQGIVAVFVFILARKLSPAEFGLVGIANIWNTFFYLFLELGFAAGLVQRKEITSSHIAAAFLINVSFGLTVMSVSMVFSGPASAALKAPEAQPVIFALSASFLLTAVASVPIALAQRALAFKALALRDFAANAIAGTGGIVLAMMGFGVWAVVVNSLLLNGLLAVLLWSIAPHPIVLGNVTCKAIKEMWGFGARVFSYTALKYLMRNADSLAVGALFGPERLGLYSFAQRVTSAPTKSLQLGLATFLFPRGSKFQDDATALKELFLISFTILNYALLLFSILLATIGVELLLKVFGRQWESAVMVIRILTLYHLLSPAIVPVAELLKAANRPNWLLSWAFLQTALAAAALWSGSHFGFHWSVVGLVGASWITMPWAGYMVARLTELRWTEFLQRVWKSYVFPVCTASLMIAGWELWNGHHQIASCICSVAAISFGLYAFRIDQDLRMIARRLFKAKFRR